MTAVILDVTFPVKVLTVYPGLFFKNTALDTIFTSLPSYRYMPGETKFCASSHLLHVGRALIVTNHDGFTRPGVSYVPEGSIDLTRDLLLPQSWRKR